MTPPEEDTLDAEQDEAAEEEKKKLTLQTEVEDRSACERHVTVTIARDDIDRYFSEAIDELMPTANVPGFRSGRAPRKLVENRFRKELADQIKGSLLMDSMTQVSEEEDFSAISEPDFDYEAIELPDEGPMTFEFDIEVRPEFEIPQWKGLKIERAVRDIGPADVDEQLKKLLRRNAEIVPKDGPVELEDYVTVNLAFTRNDDVLSQIEDEMVCVKPVLSFHDGKIEGFDKLLVGASAGDHHETKMTLSDDSPNEELRGQEIDVAVEVVNVNRLDLPKLTDDFLSRLGGFDDEGDLRDAIQSELERQLEYHRQQGVRQQITALLTESAKWELPPEMLRRQSGRELERSVLELRRAGFSDEEIHTHENELRQNSLSSTGTALKEHFILERLAEQEEIDIAPGDYDAEIKLIAAQSNETPRRVRARLEKRGAMDTLRNQIIERKVIELITSHAKFKEVPFQRPENVTEAVDHTVGGPTDEIPEAKHAPGPEKLREPADRT